MSEVRLKTPIDQSFSRAKSGAVWGRIYFEIDSGQFFPNCEWTDMVVAFEIAWLRALLGLFEGQSGCESVRFYDGPFVVEMSAKGPGLAELSFTHNEIRQLSVEANIERLIQDAVHAAEQLLPSCEERNWTNTDTEALAALLKRASRDHNG